MLHSVPELPVFGRSREFLTYLPTRLFCEFTHLRVIGKGADGRVYEVPVVIGWSFRQLVGSILLQSCLSVHSMAPGYLSLERQSARMSTVTNDDLTRSGTRCFIAVPLWQQWVSKG